MRVVIAEDQALLRQGLARLLRDEGHVVVAELPDAQTLLTQVSELGPDLVILDVRMPPTFTDEGTLAAAEIKREFPATGVLVLSQHVETTHTAGLVALGGFGYLLKDRVLDVADFLAAAERVAGGGSVLDPQLVETLIASARRDDPLGSLSERENDVLALMAQGLTNTGIARRLVLSERTVEGHVRHLLQKLDIPEDDDTHRRVLAVLTHLHSVTHP